MRARLLPLALLLAACEVTEAPPGAQVTSSGGGRFGGWAGSVLNAVYGAASPYPFGDAAATGDQAHAGDAAVAGDQAVRQDLTAPRDLTAAADPQRIQTASCGPYNAGTTPPRTASLTGVPSSNTIIAVTIFNRGGSLTLGDPGVTDSKGHTYAVDALATPGTRLYVYRATVTSGGSITVNVNIGQYDYVECDVAVITGIDTSGGSPVLATSSGGASGTTLSAGSLSLSQNAWVIAASGGGTYSGTSTASSPFTKQTTWHDAYGVMDGELAAGTSSPSWTLSAGDGTAYAIAVAYKALNAGTVFDMARPQDLSRPPDLSGGGGGGADLSGGGGGGDLAGSWNADLGYPLPTGLVTSGGYTRVKSPASGMHWTAGKPGRVLADGIDSNGWIWLCGRTTAADVRVYLDGALVDTIAQGDCSFEVNYYESRSAFAAGLTAGVHTLTTKARVCGSGSAPCANGNTGLVVNGDNQAIITVDPAPTHANAVNLSSDLVLSGATALTWDDATVTCTNGARVTGSTSGAITIRNSHVFGCGAYGNNGIDVTTSGAVSITGSVFEATAPLKITATGTSAIDVSGNEFRSSMWVTYSAWNPDVGGVLDLSGVTTSGAKTFKGNRVYGGQVIFAGDAWAVGGLHDSESNVFVGPRAMPRFDHATNAVLRGNYLHHDYIGGWSQGFNLYNAGSSTGMLAEHNVIKDGSWPVQAFCGEFRYNLVVNSGHDFWRSACSSTSIHHNLFVHASGPDGDFNGGLYFYSGEAGLQIFNNTFDGNTPSMALPGFDAPAVAFEGSTVASYRNNLALNFASQAARANLFHNGIVAGGKGGGVGTLTAADYNAFWNNDGVPKYSSSFGGSYGSHDVTTNPQITPSSWPYWVDEGAVIAGAAPVSYLLADAARRYRPAPGSPLCDAGTPGDGTGTDIGAVGCGVEAAADRFGIGMDSAWTLPPSLLSTLRAKYTGATSQWSTFKSALDAEVAIAQPEGGEYQGNTVCQWIPKFLIGWQAIRQSTAWQNNTGGARALARSYASAGLRAMRACATNYIVGPNFGAQFLKRGDGTTSATLPGTFTTGPTISTCPVTTLTATRGASPNGADVVSGLSGTWYVQKISLTNDGSPAYSEGTSWRHGANTTCTDGIDCGAAISWEATAGGEPANGTTYYVTGCDLAASLTTKSTPADYSVSGTSLTWTSTPASNLLEFAKGIYGTDSADGSTQVQNTMAHQAGGVTAQRIDSGYTDRNLAYACLGLDWLGPVPWLAAADRAELEATCAQMYKFVNDYCRSSAGGCWDAGSPVSNYGAGHELLLVYAAGALDHRRGVLSSWRTDYQGRYASSLLAAISGAAPSMRGGYPPEAWGGYGVDSGEYTAKLGAILYQLGWLPSYNSLTPWTTWSNAAVENLISVAPTKSTILQHAEAQGYPGAFSGDRMKSMLPTADSTHAAFARYVLAGNGWTTPGIGSDWAQLLWYDPAGTATDPTGSLALANFADGTGLMTSRADWTFGSTMVSLRIGSDPTTSAGHFGYNAGHVNVQRGADPLLVTMRNFSDDFAGQGAQSREANLVIIDDAQAGAPNGQVYQFSEGYWDNGNITFDTFENGSGYAYGSGDYSAAYWNNGNPAGPALALTREVLHLRPDHVAVHDRVTLRAAGAAWVARQVWHSPNKSFNVSGSTFRVDNGSGRVFGAAFGSPSPTLTDAAVAFNGVATRELQIAATGSTSRRYWTGLHVTTTSTGSPDAMADVTDSGGSMDCIRLGADLGCFTSSSSRLSTSATVSFTAPAGVTRVVLTNVQLSRSYTLTGASSGSATSSSKGVLVFALGGGGGAVTVH